VHFIAGPEIGQQTINAAISYFVIQLYGFPLTALTFAINATLRGVGNTRAAFYTNTVANLVNVFLNYCLIEGRLGFPRMEVAGASLATIIGQGAAFGMALYMVLSGKQYIRLDLKTRFRFDFRFALPHPESRFHRLFWWSPFLGTLLRME
jgi:Na+-driven multidrug efflux pump